MFVLTEQTWLRMFFLFFIGACGNITNDKQRKKVDERRKE